MISNGRNHSVQEPEGWGFHTRNWQNYEPKLTCEFDKLKSRVVFDLRETHAVTRHYVLEQRIEKKMNCPKFQNNKITYRELSFGESGRM